LAWRIIEQVLGEESDGSRSHVVPRTAAQMRRAGLAPEHSDREYIELHGDA
jgi:hypothetical protein